MNRSVQVAMLLMIPILSLGVYYLLKKYVLFKYNFKKRYLIPALALIILAPILLVMADPNFVLPLWAYLLQMVMFTVVFLVYVDVLKKDKIAKKKRMEPNGKPMAKPNRAKNKM